MFVRDSLIFWKKNCFAPKWAINILRYFEVIGKFWHECYKNLVYNENIFYLLYSWTNAITGKNVVPEIWAKMHLTNHIGSISTTKLLNSLIFCMYVDRS